MSMLPVIPTWLRIVVVLIVVGWLEYQLVTYAQGVERQACELKQTTGALIVTTADVAKSESLRADEGATSSTRIKASDDHIARIHALETERDAAATAAERLRRQLSATVQRGQQCGPQGDPAAEQGGQAVAALGAALGACTDRYRDMAADAGERYATGLRCEAEYDALTPAHKD